MPLKPVVPDRTEKWVPPSQAKDKKPTTFLLRPLTHGEHKHIDNITSSVDQYQERHIKTGDVIWWRVKFGLAGWENYDIEFKAGPCDHTQRKCVTDACLETLPRLEFLQLSGAIADMTEPDEGE